MKTADWPASFPRADVVLVVPPFAPTFQPSIACHLLQACAHERGHDVIVVYANLLFAEIVGHRAYEQMLERRLYLEHIFKDAAFGTSSDGSTQDHPLLVDGVRAVGPWLQRLGNVVRSIAPRVVGATCSFEAITSSVAILNRCKETDPQITTIIGGANCEGEMAEGILSLRAQIDHVFSGESESTFPDFLEGLLCDGGVTNRVIQGSPCTRLDDLPLPVYREYFDQYALYLGDDEPASTYRAVPYESSRGCWWGQRHHCTFCGLNGMSMGFRQKTAERVATDLQALLNAYPVSRVNFVDNIMPNHYYSTLLPRLAEELPPSTSLFYEQKSNITFKKACLLKEAHVTSIQPGIESLNTHILQCMDKGVRADQNIALMRYARSLRIRLAWSLLAGFPGDRAEDYEQIADLLPHVVHLEPPAGIEFVRFDRFSPYVDHPNRFGISNLRPKHVYFDIFPPWTRYEQLAYYFDGDYTCGAFECPSVIERIEEQTRVWRERWARSPKPVLAVVHVVGNQYAVVDTRARDAPPTLDVVDSEVAEVLLRGARLEDRAQLSWAIERRLLVELDGRLVPLATASPEILMQFERDSDAVTVRSKAVRLSE